MEVRRGLVHCRVCHGEIDRDKEIEDKDWTQVSRNYFYHVSCYESWKKQKDDIHSIADEKLWKGAVYDYLKRDLKVELEWHKFNSQWHSFIKKGRTPKGIYFSVRYFYEVLKGDKDKAQGGIGIVDFIYEDAATYWCEKEQRESGIIKQIEEQMLANANREVKVVHKKQKKKKKISLDDVELMEGDK